MKRSFLPIAALIVALASCGAKEDTIINCAILTVVDSGSTILSAIHQVDEYPVYEYKSDSDDFIYLDSHLLYQKYIDEKGDSIIQKRITKESSTETVLYKFNGYIGTFRTEQNYYLNLTQRTIHSEKVIAGDTKAYDCARSYPYYQYPGDSTKCGQYETINEINLRPASEKETHSYILLGEDCTVHYRAL